MGAPESALLDGLQIGNDGTDVTCVKAQFRHVRMPGHDALAERFFQRFDRVALTEHPEWRRGFMRTVAGPANRMARRTIARDKLFAPLDRLGLRTLHHDRRNAGAGDDMRKAVEMACPPVTRAAASLAQTAAIRSASRRQASNCSCV